MKFFQNIHNLGFHWILFCRISKRYLQTQIEWKLQTGNLCSNSVFDEVNISIASGKPFVEKWKEFLHILIGQLLALKAANCCLAKRPSEDFFHRCCQIRLCKPKFNTDIADFVNKGVNIVGHIADSHVRISQRCTFWWFYFELRPGPCIQCFALVVEGLGI